MMVRWAPWLLLAVTACATTNDPRRNDRADAPSAEPRSRYSVVVKQLKDDAYPDNPDIDVRSSEYGRLRYDRLALFYDRHDAHVTFRLEGSSHDDAIILDEIDILRFMPAIPPHVRGDSYLAYLAVVNQEWNRQQVRFARRAPQLEVVGEGFSRDRLSRVDLARNCLNARLWEIFLYTREGDAEVPYYHGWFDFPRELYAHLFARRNEAPYARYARALDDWIDPPSRPVDLRLLRDVEREGAGKHTSFNDAYYPLVGERLKKRKNIITPKEPQRIADFLSDDTRFATFTPPGIYTRADPRRTELGRLRRVARSWVRLTQPRVPGTGRRLELELLFDDGRRKTRLIIGGLDPQAIPTLPVDEHHRGYQMPMGIANPTFYADYERLARGPTDREPYFGLLLDGEGRFLDSHRVGIDGPLLHRDAEAAQTLHLWILSFERHALVGHYTLVLPQGW